MLKKTLIVIFTLAFIISLASCDNKTTSETSSSASVSTESNTDSSVVSLAESSEEISVVSEESSDLTSEAASKSDVIEGIFYSEDYSFTVPEGYTLGASDDTGAMFSNGATTQLVISVSPNTEKRTTIDKATLEDTFTAILGDTKFSEFKSMKIDETNAVYFAYKMKSDNVTVYSYTAMIFTTDSLYTITLASTDDAQKAALTSVLDTFKFAE